MMTSRPAGASAPMLACSVSRCPTKSQHDVCAQTLGNLVHGFDHVALAGGEHNVRAGVPHGKRGSTGTMAAITRPPQARAA